MKQISIIALACVVLTLLSACGGKKKSEDIIAPKVEKVKPKAPVAMQEYTDERDVEWIGKIYHVAIHRHASDSLPMVKDMPLIWYSVPDWEPFMARSFIGASPF